MEEDFKRTNYSIKIPRALRLKIRLAQSVSSKASYLIAKKLFFTPMEYKVQEEEFLYKQSLHVNRELINDKKINIFTDGHPPFKVLLVHGWSGHASQFQSIGEALKQKGISYLSFRAPAHGSDEEKTSDLMEFVDCIKFINSKYGPFDTLIGHSLGAVASINAASVDKNYKKIVSIGAAASIEESIKDFCYFLGFSDEVKSMLIKYIEEKYGVSLEDHGANKLAKGLKSKGLIIHDKTDHSVDVKSAEAIHSNWKNSELMITEDLGHNKILKDADVINKITEFVES